MSIKNKPALFSAQGISFGFIKFIYDDYYEYCH